MYCPECGKKVDEMSTTTTSDYMVLHCEKCGGWEVKESKAQEIEIEKPKHD